MAAEEPGPSEEVELRVERETLRRALDDLPEAERNVLELRYGIATDNQPETIAQVVRHLHISRNRVRSLEEHGLARLGRRRKCKVFARAGDEPTHRAVQGAAPRRTPRPRGRGRCGCRS